MIVVLKQNRAEKPRRTRTRRRVRGSPPETEQKEEVTYQVFLWVPLLYCQSPEQVEGADLPQGDEKATFRWQLLIYCGRATGKNVSKLCTSGRTTGSSLLQAARSKKPTRRQAAHPVQTCSVRLGRSTTTRERISKSDFPGPPS